MRLSSAVLAAVSASSLLIGCATVSPQRHEGPMGSVVGAVQLPEGASADTVCPGLRVAVVSASGEAIGEPSVHAGHGRCLYTVDYVKADVPLKLSIQGSAPRACPSGALQPATQPSGIELQDMETRTVDVALHCA